MTRSPRSVISTFPLPGYRPCYRVWSLRHRPNYPLCDCLRTELPVEAQALSSGRLGVPERNHTCPACGGDGWMRIGYYHASCPRCAGCGERKADREPADHAFPDWGDGAVRRRVTAARTAGRLGVK